MGNFEEKDLEELVQELEALEEQYIRKLTSNLDKVELNNLWVQMKEIKKEIEERKKKGTE